MVEQGVIVFGTNQRTGEHHSVKGNIVLGHELVELNLLWILPPPLPFLSIAGSDGEVAA